MMGLNTWFTGLRPLLRNPRFAGTVIVVLALGIGINVATLGLLYLYYASPMPYSHGGQMISVYFTANQPMGHGMSMPTWQRLKKAAPALADSGLYVKQGYNLTLGSHQRRLNGVQATASMFSTLGVQPMLGRVFGPKSNKPGAKPVVVLSYGLWQTLFDGKASAIGKTMKLNGKLFTVIGVMPKAFKFPTSQAAFWTPQIIRAYMLRAYSLTNFYYQMVGRIAPGAAKAEFLAQANRVLKNEIANFPIPKAIPLFKKFHLSIAAQSWRASRLGNLQQSLILVFCATALLMLLVWFNLANLFLARSYSRRSELTMRRILGASTGRLVLSLGRENLILSLVGAGLGVVFGHFLLVFFAGSTIAVTASAIGSASWPALIVIAVVLALITTAIFSLISFGFLRGNNLSAALGEAGSHTSPGRGTKRLRMSLIAGQIALACAIGGTGLFLGRSLINLNAVNLGFKPNHVVTFKMSFPYDQYPYPLHKMVGSLQRLRGAVARSPGMGVVSVSSDVPLAGGQSVSGALFPRPVNLQIHPTAYAVATDAEHFRSFGIPLLRGRNFTPADANSKTGVAILDTVAAKQLFGTTNVVGREFSYDTAHDDNFGRFFHVIGVVPTVRRNKLGAASAKGTVYVDFTQLTGKATRHRWAYRNWYLVVQSPLPAATVISQVRKIAGKLISGVPLYDVRTMNQRVGSALSSNKLLTVLVLIFAIGAIVLAALGLYAVQAYSVAQRAREFAIRAALGANRSRLIAMVLGETARLLVIGLVAGLAGLAGIGIAFASASAFYGIAAVDPASMAIVAAVLALAALAASWFPAWRASRVAPDKALRS